MRLVGRAHVGVASTEATFAELGVMGTMDIMVG